jgi:hypothetical protein
MMEPDDVIVAVHGSTRHDVVQKQIYTISVYFQKKVVSVDYKGVEYKKTIPKKSHFQLNFESPEKLKNKNDIDGN